MELPEILTEDILGKDLFFQVIKAKVLDSSRDYTNNTKTQIKDAADATVLAKTMNISQWTWC